MERIDKPEELKDVMNIKLEPDCISGNDVLTVEGLSKSFDNLHLFLILVLKSNVVNTLP